MFGIFIKTVVISRMIIEWLIDILKVSLSIVNAGALNLDGGDVWYQL